MANAHSMPTDFLSYDLFTTNVIRVPSGTHNSKRTVKTNTNSHTITYPNTHTYVSAVSMGTQKETMLIYKHT